MERGYVKLWRKIEDSRSWSRSALHRALMITLMVRSNWKDSYFRGEKISRGQIATSTRGLAEELGAPQTSVFRAMKDLVDDGFMTVENVERKWSRITLINWDNYQCINNATWNTDESQAEHCRNAAGTQAEQSKELKNERIREEESTPLSPSGIVPPRGTVSTAAEDGPFSMSEPEPKPEPEYLPWEGAPIPGFDAPPLESAPVPAPVPAPEPKPAKTRRTKAEKQTLTKRPDYTPEFEELWHWYPNKTNKQGAFQTYLTYLEAGELPEHADFVHRIKMRRWEPDWEKDGGKYVPHMQTWLNRRGWEDGGCFDPDSKPQKFLSPEKLAVRQEIIDYYQGMIDTALMPMEAEYWKKELEDALDIEGVAPWQWSN